MCSDLYSHITPTAVWRMDSGEGGEEVQKGSKNGSKGTSLPFGTVVIVHMRDGE